MDTVRASSGLPAGGAANKFGLSISEPWGPERAAQQQQQLYEGERCSIAVLEERREYRRVCTPLNGTSGSICVGR